MNHAVTHFSSICFKSPNNTSKVVTVCHGLVISDSVLGSGDIQRPQVPLDTSSALCERHERVQD